MAAKVIDIRKAGEKAAVTLLDRTIGTAIEQGASAEAIDAFLRNHEPPIEDAEFHRMRVAAMNKLPRLGAGDIRMLFVSIDNFRAIFGLAPTATTVKAGDLVLDPDDPMKSARTLVQQRHTVDGVLALRHQAGVFYRFEPRAACYRERDDATMRAEVWRFLESAKEIRNHNPFKPNNSSVANVHSALQALTNLPTSVAAPVWLSDADARYAPLDVMACVNGLLHIPTRTLLRATPQFYTLNGIDFGYDAQAPAPTKWLKFLKQIWPDDQESIDTLQEIFGYLLTPDTRHQKVFMIVGPPRSGKGTIGRIAGRLVGPHNICNPKLAAFGRNFGMSVLVGKTLATITDARISGRTDSAAVVETLLSISGEDEQTIERKYLPDWNGKLSARFLILTNELPKLGDDSGALPSRFIVLRMTESFFGKENLNLSNELLPELPGILNWALVGRDRLYKRGYFLQPKSASELIEDFNNLSSPQKVFVDERCERGTGWEVSQDDLYDEWKNWCSDNGIKAVGTKQTFARSLRAALPWLTSTNRRDADGRERRWQGLRLKEDVATKRAEAATRGSASGFQGQF